MQIRLNEKEVSEAIGKYLVAKNPGIERTGAVYISVGKGEMHVIVDNVVMKKPESVMTFASVDQWNDGDYSTSLQGYIDITYAELVEKLGEPKGVHDDYKSDAEWWIKFGDGTFATVYNYKDGKNYNGDDGEETENITNWHIGGVDQKAVKLVNKIFGRKV